MKQPIIEIGLFFVFLTLTLVFYENRTKSVWFEAGWGWFVMFTVVSFIVAMGNIVIFAHG